MLKTYCKSKSFNPKVMEIKTGYSKCIQLLFRRNYRIKLDQMDILKKIKPNFLSEDEIGYTEYYQENGLRKVYPYYDVFTYHSTKKMIGKTVLQDLKTFTGVQKLLHFSDEKLVRMINNGFILVNSQKTSPAYRIRKNDVMTQITHKHEMPVLFEEIEIVEDNEDTLVVNKPSSLSCQRANNSVYNTLPLILQYDYGYKGNIFSLTNSHVLFLIIVTPHFIYKYLHLNEYYIKLMILSS